MFRGMKIFIRFGILLIIIFCSVVSFAYDVKYGDIIIFGNYEPKYGVAGYETIKYLAFMQEIGRNSGIYNHFFGFPIETWDDRSLHELRLLKETPKYFNGDFNLKRTFWGHVEIVTENKELDINFETWDIIAVLRPNAEMKKYVSIDALTDRYLAMLANSYGYNQPFIYIFMRWAFNAHIDWFSTETYDLWARIYKLERQSFIDIPAQDYITNDIADPNFVYRTIDCSSLTMWSIIYGMSIYNYDYRNLILNNDLAAAAIDCISPAQVGWWLYNHQKWVDIVDVLRAKGNHLNSEVENYDE